jgi:GT2 family glycosyltransferase
VFSNGIQGVKAMLNEGPRVTIIIATYNSEETLSTCLESVAGQSYPNKELIVMDGGSADHTVDILRAHEDTLTYWESEPDRGIYHAWNKALTRSTGEWIHFLGSDDRFTASNVIGRMAAQLAEVPDNVGLVYGKLVRETPDGQPIETLGDDWAHCRGKLAVRMLIPHGAAFHRRSLFEAYGLFDEQFLIAGDYEFTLRALKDLEGVFVEDIVVIAQQCDGISSRPETTFKRNAEMARARRLNGMRAYPLQALPVVTENILYGAMHRFLGERMVTLVRNIYRKMTGRPTLLYPFAHLPRHESITDRHEPSGQKAEKERSEKATDE